MATENTTLAVKVSRDFAKKYRAFCDLHSLQVGKFTEKALAEVMEDFYFGTKAQRILSTASGQVVTHARAFRAPSARKR
jgi:hypothetical protein